MPDTSSARRHAEHRPLRESGLEPVDGTWFETGDEPPVDLPLIALIPVPRIMNDDHRRPRAGD